ncbi:MAG: DNA replication/repair protein RecF [Aeromonadales bacterium]|nr:DNA replication/repair protein RecF [Aeromonadales bacterium]MDY2891778.1 DNA replication/repair protein RecF [Succinivibrio sp.]
MIISRLLIQDFRNIGHLDLRPSETINIIHGPNGSGKTSVLEAISYLALGHSFRNANVHHLIKNDRDSFTLSAAVTQENGEHDTLGISRVRGKAKDLAISINGARLPRLLDLVDRVCVQIIHPDGYMLVSGTPDNRRGFLDWGVYYTEPDFKKNWIQYRRILAQRNALLKSGGSNAQFEIWDGMLAELSESITEMRQKYLDEIQDVMQDTLAMFLGGLKFRFTLSQGWENGKKLKEILKLNLEKDRVLGYTFYGCHRADLKIRVNQYPAGDTLSRGQIKLLVCAMRLSQGKILQKMTGRKCIYLIDDLNSELDSNSRRLLLDEISASSNQIFITNITRETSLPDNRDPSFIDMGTLRNAQAETVY